MGLRIKLKNANFENFIGYSTDILHPNLIGYYTFDTSGIVVNKVTGQVTTKIGSPTFGENFVNITSVNGLVDKSLVTSGEISYIAIANAGAAAMICGHVDYDVSATTSDAILRNTKFAILSNNASVGEVPTRATATRFVAGVLADTTKVLYVSDAGVLTKTSDTKVAGNTNTLPFKMGGHSLNNVLPQQTTLYTVAVFNKALTETEINSFYAQLKNLFPITA